VDEQGHYARYPYNPNGSVSNIAGIADKTGRILGLMPHPERHISHFQHPNHTREMLRTAGDGLAIFKNAVKYFS
jgi:phosphoribosylformylglycinamidine synthase